MEYIDIILDKLKKLQKSQTSVMNKVGGLVGNVIKNQGIIYIFGCGHSHLIALDCFYRAGGLVNVQPILDEKLMLHQSASYSSVLEKKEESVSGLLDEYNITTNDILFVISTSSKNGAPVQMAIDGKSKGLTVVGLGSMEYYADKSKHSSGKKLFDVCDYFIDNCVPHGDAVCELSNKIKSAPVSTVLTSFIMQNVLLIAEKQAIKDGVTPDVFLSGNVDGGAEYNEKLIAKYKSRIKSL